MSVKIDKNRDLFFKFCFMYFLTNIVKILGINEEIDEILPTEAITFKNIKPEIFHNFLDFHVLTKSGKIMVFEFKKGPLRIKDLKQALNYADKLHCKYKEYIKMVLIVISKEGKINQCTYFDFTYHPQIIRTKKINKQKDLNIIRDKFHNNIKLTDEESSLLIALPLFEIEDSEEEITKEICTYIKDKSHCIPDDEVDKVSIAMYLNICEYVEDGEQEELLEMINMAEHFEGVIAQVENRGKIKWMNEGECNIIRELLKSLSIDEVCSLIHRDRTEIERILE